MSWFRINGMYALVSGPEQQNYINKRLSGFEYKSFFFFERENIMSIITKFNRNFSDRPRRVIAHRDKFRIEILTKDRHEVRCKFIKYILISLKKKLDK